LTPDPFFYNFLTLDPKEKRRILLESTPAPGSMATSNLDRVFKIQDCIWITKHADAVISDPDPVMNL